MASNEDEPRAEAQVTGKPLPAGYRQGVVTAISVILGFALYFLRFWSLEAEGDWTWASVCAAVPTILSIACLAVALWRSLQVADDDEPVYRRTLKWFLSGILLALAGVIASAIAL
ncbi:hypothetical protein [Taklimakanibacter deserti]|uniref:hypothetical protein n=1 Tax=Taklimakanibacter deserti TaxID=2267839 RepID=UPI000E65C887